MAHSCSQFWLAGKTLTSLYKPHETLGVAHDAGPAELKRAFRRLAMRWHPDRNDHPEATERFKAIRAAYDFLAAVDDEEDPEISPEETSEETPEPAAKAADIRLNLEISLEEGVTGCRKSVRYIRGKPCATCDGSGEYGMAKTRFCAACHGSGRVRDGQRGLSNCGDCGGRGFFSERICPDCRGSGRETSEVSLEITVPPGMLAGDELRLAGQGEPGDASRTNGDLYLTVIISSHPLFRLQGRDVHYDMPISALALLAGAEISLLSPAGEFVEQLVPGPVEPKTMRFPGRGYPGRGKSPAGDLQVTLAPVFPRQLNARQRKLMLQAHSALLDDIETTLPEIAEWRRNAG